MSQELKAYVLNTLGLNYDDLSVTEKIQVGESFTRLQSQGANFK
jgi:hypothetical protein